MLKTHVEGLFVLYVNVFCMCTRDKAKRLSWLSCEAAVKFCKTIVMNKRFIKQRSVLIFRMQRAFKMKKYKHFLLVFRAFALHNIVTKKSIQVSISDLLIIWEKSN